MMKLQKLVPALLAALVLGATVAYATTGPATLSVDYRDMKVTYDGVPVALVDATGAAVEPFAYNGTTYLPVRAIAGALGLEVGWDNETATVTLTTPEAQKPVYITATGRRWHYDEHCNGGTYWEVPYSSAIGMGLTPCDKCVLTENP